MVNNYLITGYWGEPHVTAENDRGINAAIFGTGRFVLPVGKQLRAEYIGNNTIRLYDGKLIDNGAVAGIPAGTYIDLLVPEAGQGMNRSDLIVFQYTKDASTLIETGNFLVLRGEESEGAAFDPVLIQEDLMTDEAVIDQMPLYRVSVSGATISAPAPMFGVSRSMSSTSFVATNLLDNSDFRNPLNRAGKSSYRGLGFSIDRWVVPNDTSALTVGDGFVLFQNDSTASNATFVNRLRAGTLKKGKTYTGVLCFNDGTVVFGSGVCNGNTPVVLTDASRSIYMQIATSTDYDPVSLVVPAGKFDRLAYAALYEGEYTDGTLPTYTPKGYGAEVANCQVATYGELFGWDLLWENASPDSSFTAQTINVDLSKYRYFVVDTNTTPGPVIVRRGGSTAIIHAAVTSTDASDVVVELARRLVYGSNNGVTFEKVLYTRYTSATGKFSATAESTSLAKPYRIFGVRGVS